MKRKKINRSILFLSLCGIFVTIVAMSVVYAALSSKLLIDGSAEIPNSSFGLKVEEYLVNDVYGDDYVQDCQSFGAYCESNYVIIGKGQVVNKPTLSGTSINNFKISVQMPGDTVGLVYKIINNGTIPVKLSNVVGSTPKITSLNNNSSDIDWVNTNVEFVSMLEDLEGTDIQMNNILCPGDIWMLTFGAVVPDTVTTLPSGAVEISNLGISYEFLQTDQYLCEDK